jgi:hypothetical protein
VAAGLVASGLLVLYWLAFPFELGATARAGARRLDIFWHEYVMTTGGFTYRYSREINATFRWASVAVLPIAMAVMGGWLALRFKLVLARGDLGSGGPTAPVEGTRAIPVRRAMMALAVATLLLAPASGVSMLIGWRNGHLARMHRHQVLERFHTEQFHGLMRMATLWEESPPSFFPDPADPATRAAEASRLRVLAEESRTEAERSGRIWRQSQEAARRPWRSLSPDPPPP